MADMHINFSLIVDAHSNLSEQQPERRFSVIDIGLLDSSRSEWRSNDIDFKRTPLPSIMDISNGMPFFTLLLNRLPLYARHDSGTAHHDVTNKSCITKMRFRQLEKVLKQL